MKALVVGVMAAGLTLGGCCDCDPQTCPESEQVAASTVDTSAWPEGWQDAWPKILSFAGTWQLVSFNKDGDRLGTLIADMTIDASSLKFIPDPVDTGCWEDLSSAAGNLALTWPSGAVEEAPISVWVGPESEPVEYAGTVGTLASADPHVLVNSEWTMYGDGGMSGTFQWSDGGVHAGAWFTTEDASHEPER